ncbi:MAG TPA: hypothetical protein VF808_05745 [Ktedonobacterales bacterium]
MGQLVGGAAAGFTGVAAALGAVSDDEVAGLGVSLGLASPDSLGAGLAASFAAPEDLLSVI